MFILVLAGCGLAIGVMGTVCFIRLLWKLTSDMVAPIKENSSVIGFETPRLTESEGDIECK